MPVATVGVKAIPVRSGPWQALRRTWDNDRASPTGSPREPAVRGGRALMSTGFVVWMTGLSGAGKSTLAARLATELRGRGVPVEILDGDVVRRGASADLGFSKTDRETNVRRVGRLAADRASHGTCVIAALISPYRASRDEQRALLPGRFVEVYCRCDLDVLVRRDPKGLYRKALAGEIERFTGVSDPYEPPENAEVVLDSGRDSEDECVRRLLDALEARGFVQAAP